MKQVIIYQTQGSEGHWSYPKCYVPYNKDDFDRCIQLSKKYADIHNNAVVWVEDELKEINVLDYIDEKDILK